MPSAIASRVAAPIDDVRVRAYRIPCQTPESDGTLQWASTTLVYAEICAAGTTGIGFTYADLSAAALIEATLAPVLLGRDALQTAARWNDLYAHARNLGRGGIVSMAISCLDVALWDLKAKAYGLPACALLGPARDAVPVYGSGGFTSYPQRRLCEQLAGWVDDGIPRVKMKVGRAPEDDPQRVAAARRAIGSDTELFVDANGAYDPRRAVAAANRFEAECVAWFEEPVYRDDYAGTRFVRERVPGAMEVASGEYGYGPCDFARMLDAGCVDVLQADATRCGGFSGLFAVDALCQANFVPLSTHCAPYLHLHAALACKQLRHSEYFFDHVRIERMLFDGAAGPQQGALHPDLGRPGIGLELKTQDAEAFAL